MPIKVPDNLPAINTLKQEQIFVMQNSRAFSQDIRPLKILILNLMPNKIETETQLLRLLSNTPLQIDIDLLMMESHASKNTESTHLEKFYTTFDNIKDNFYDGIIITGAPVELLDFNDVDYWPELTKIFEWINHHVFASLFICWGAQAALNYYYNIPKYTLHEKMFGIFEHHLNRINNNFLLNGLDDIVLIPHSRHTENKISDIQQIQDLQILIQSTAAGAFAIIDESHRRLFLTGHIEYDAITLNNEYQRDLNANKSIQIPYNYYPNNDPSMTPYLRWRSSANILFSNWINYVYQDTPYQLEKLNTV